MSKSKFKNFRKKEETTKSLTKLEQDVAKTNPKFVEWLKTRRPKKKD
jgi:hypothetical protein